MSTSFEEECYIRDNLEKKSLKDMVSEEAVEKADEFIEMLEEGVFIDRHKLIYK